MNDQEYARDRQKNNRLYLDIVKGVAIFLMLWGHCIQYCTNGEFDFFENPVFKFIYSFHMPLFMLVSGYLFFFSCKKRNLSEILVHRTQSLVQPIIMCSILNYFLTIVLYERTLSSVVDGPWINTFSSLWFLWSVLVASLAVGIAVKCTNKLILQILIICIGFGAAYLFPNSTLNLYMYPYFVIGFFFAKYKAKIPELLICLKYLSLVLFPIMLMFFEKKHYIYTTGIIPTGNIVEQIKIDEFRWAIGLVGSIFMMVVIEILYRLIFVKKPAIIKTVSQLGVKSLQVYCLSVSLLSFWLPKLYKKLCGFTAGNIFASNMLVYNYLFTPLVAILYALLIYYIVKLMDKTKISRVIFGR